MQNHSHLLSFEGIEGCGKSTQIQLFKSALESKGFNVHVFREPGATSFGEQIRNALLGSKTALDPLAQAYAFTAARAQLMTEEVLPLLSAEKNIVILDRFIDSTYAYQGEAQGMDKEIIKTLHSFSPLDKAIPNMTFYLKIDLQTSMDRQGARGDQKDYFESQQNEFHSKLIKGYDIQASNHRERIRTVDGSGTVEDVQKQILFSWDKYYDGK